MIELLDGERWYGGAVADGRLMPFGDHPYVRDLGTSNGSFADPRGGGNQSAPLLISTRGRYLWSDEPFRFGFDGAGELHVEGDVTIQTAGTTLRDAFRAACATHFPPSGGMIDPRMISAPQYNTWIEAPYRPTQQAVIDYARAVADHGFPPGVIMIDDKWSVDYGVWEFEPSTFDDPRAMCAELHDLGFSIMVWLVPFVSPDSATSRELAAHGLLITEPDGRPAVRRWWNGFSAVLDLTNPATLDWLRTKLAALTDLGVDGFKLDAADLHFYAPTDVTHAGGGAVAQCEAWASLGAEYGFNEMRACWKQAGRPLAQRLHDKARSWGSLGLASLIPDGIAQSMIGHVFTCPDMIGGGELSSFADGRDVDQELFVRFAQCSALFPMMQFSMAPWRVLDDEHLAVVRSAVEIRQALMDEILVLCEHGTASGEPVLRPLAYHHPGYEHVNDQFLLGEDLLVTPVLRAGATRRRVVLPPGRWAAAEDGSVVDGPAEIEVEVGLRSLPRFRRTAAG